MEIEAERLRALNAPILPAVLIKIAADHPKVPVEEQYVSLGAAVENILLAAHALGFGAMLTSGRKVARLCCSKRFAGRRHSAWSASSPSEPQ